MIFDWFSNLTRHDQKTTIKPRNDSIVGGDVVGRDKIVLQNQNNKASSDISEDIYKPLNPNVFVENLDIFFEINHEPNNIRRVVRIDVFRIKALADVQEYRFQLNKRTAARGISLSYLKGVIDLIEVSDQGDLVEYLIKLPKIRHNLNHTFVLAWNVEDITHAPYVTGNFCMSAGFKRARILFIVPKNEVTEVEYFVRNLTPRVVIRTDNLNTRPFPSFSYEKDCTTWEFGDCTEHKADVHYSYTIKWQWGKCECLSALKH